MTYLTVSVTILGTVKGRIWMPAAICTKDVRHTFHDVRREPDSYTRGNWPGSLRAALLSEDITNDGDFQSCGLLFGATLKVVRVNPATGTRRTRYWEIRATARPWIGRKADRQLRRAYVRDCFVTRRDDREVAA